MASSKKHQGWLEQLKEVKPEVGRLFYRGVWEERLFDRCVAVVGSRRMTGYGERWWRG